MEHPIKMDDLGVPPMDWKPPYGSTLGTRELDGEDKQHRKSLYIGCVICNSEP